VIDLFVMSSVVETSGREEDSLFVLGQIPPLRLAFGNPPVGMTTPQAGPWNLPANMQCIHPQPPDRRGLVPQVT
jgi:hypothetical protein